MGRGVFHLSPTIITTTVEIGLISYNNYYESLYYYFENIKFTFPFRRLNLIRLRSIFVGFTNIYIYSELFKYTFKVKCMFITPSFSYVN
jgi:hypothetical protein